MKKSLSTLLLLLAGCAGADYVTFTGLQQGTTYTIIANSASSTLESDISAVFERMDGTFSMFNPRSLTSRINRNKTDSITPVFEKCFTLAKKIHSLTEGFFDPTVKPLVDAWGFGVPGREDVSGDYDQVAAQIPDIMRYVGFDKIYIREGRIVKADPRVQLDFSSIAKGFTVDMLAEMLDGKGVTDYMVEVGGEVRCRGVNARGKNWRIGIENSWGVSEHPLAAIASPNEKFPAIATSGNYRNNFTDASGHRRVHTIDPKTGFPVVESTEAPCNGVYSISIAAPDCATADGWATAIMAASAEESEFLRARVHRLLEKEPAIEWFMNFPGGWDYSPGFPIVEEF